MHKHPVTGIPFQLRSTSYPVLSTSYRHFSVVRLQQKDIMRSDISSFNGGKSLNVLKMFALSIGASLIGSSSVVILEGLFNATNSAQIDSLRLRWIVLVAGVIAVLYATGLIENFLTRPFLVHVYRRIFPTIAVVSDLDWMAKGTYVWAWEKMSPDEWVSEITGSAKKSRANLRVKPIRITHRRARWFLDQYTVIVNPYGSVYPELDVKELMIWSRIRDYVFHGGMFVSVADIPFYYAYDPRRNIRYDTGKSVHQYVPQLGFQSFIPFSETPFAVEAKLSIINTEKVPNMASQSLNLKSSPTSTQLEPVGINRAILASTVDEYGIKHEINHVRSIVEEITLDSGILCSPICFIYFGGGKFLVSLLFLGENKQSDIVCENIIDLLCGLVVKEAEDQLGILMKRPAT